jgi:hypothetical protein
MRGASKPREKQTEGNTMVIHGVPDEIARSFYKAVPRGDRGMALRNLLCIMHRSAHVERGLWQSCMERPKTLVVTRKWKVETEDS